MKKEKVINGMYFLETDNFFISSNYKKADVKVKSEDVALRCLDAAIKGECKTKEDYIKLINSL